MFWDFHVHSPESVHALMFLFGDRGIPGSVRHVNAYSGNTYMLTRADGTCHYVRIHIKSDQGVRVLDQATADSLAGTEPDNHIVDLQSSIDRGDLPSWTVFFQVMHPHAVLSASHQLSIFDMTKIWPHSEYPLRRVGKMTLNRNPKNWFAEVEQSAFSPSNMVRGIEASPDVMLQARMFAYPDAARYRLGVNYQQLPTNASRAPVYAPTERDGLMNLADNYKGDPDYTGSSLKEVQFATSRTPPLVVGTKASTPETVGTSVTFDDFEQARALWQDVMAKQPGAHDRFLQNLASHVVKVKSRDLRFKVYELFQRVDESLGKRLEQHVEADR